MWWRHGNCGHRFWAELPAWDLQGHNEQSNYDSNNNSKLIHHLSKTPNALHLCADVLVTALMKFWSSIQRSSMHGCYFWDRRQSVTGEAQAHASCSNHVLVHSARNIHFLFLSKANFSIRHVYFYNAQLPSAIKRRNHLYQIFWWSVKGCLFCGGSKMPSPIEKSVAVNIGLALPRSPWLEFWSIHRESKKQDTKLLAITSLTITRFSNFYSLADSVVNLQQIHVQIFHHALNTSLHYLVKYECRKMASFWNTYCN